MSKDFNYFKFLEEVSSIWWQIIGKGCYRCFQSRKAKDIEPFNREIEDACKQAVRTEIVIAWSGLISSTSQH